jgi:hypothetical protein
MPRISKFQEQVIRNLIDRIEAAAKTVREVLDRAAGAKDLPSSNQPLAPRKPAGGRAKGDTPGTRSKARKGSGKK